MEKENDSKFQAWFESELEWTRCLRRYKFKFFLKCIGITVLVALLVGLIGVFLDANSDSDVGMILVAAMIFSGVLVILILFFTMLPGFLKGSYARKIRRTMKRQGLNELQKDQFAKEQLVTQGDPIRSVSFSMAGNLPARFTLSERFACLTGGMNYGPQIVQIGSAESVRVSVYKMNVPAMTRVLGFIVRTNTEFTTYLIQFIGQGKEQGSLVLNDRPSCDKVLDVLRRRFPVAVG